MVDRFHDGTAPHAHTGPGPLASVFQTPDDFYGGKIEGITQQPGLHRRPRLHRHLALAGLREQCRRLPRLQHQQLPRHRSAVRHEAGPGRSGRGGPRSTKPPMRIILDVVINHSGDNWYYPGDVRTTTPTISSSDFGDWRRADRPDPDRAAQPGLLPPPREDHGNYDAYPENQHGDIVGLKDYANDDDAIGSDVINTLIKAHCYWIREADVDGFRVDAVKHMGELACSRFCSNVREYAYSLGKRGFFLFGEVAIARRRHLQPLHRPEHLAAGRQQHRLLRDRLAARLPTRRGRLGDQATRRLRDVIKGFGRPADAVRPARGAAQPSAEPRRDRPLPGDVRRQPRLVLAARRAVRRTAPTDEQVIGRHRLSAVRARDAVHLLRHGAGLRAARAATTRSARRMFDQPPPAESCSTPECRIYQEIAQIAAVMRAGDAAALRPHVLPADLRRRNVLRLALRVSLHPGLLADAVRPGGAGRLQCLQCTSL